MTILQTIIDYGALFSIVAIAVDILLQIRKIYKRKSSADISLQGLTIRLVAASFLLIKFFSLKDIYLSLGQGIFLIAFITYLSLATYYRKPRHNKP